MDLSDLANQFVDFVRSRQTQLPDQQPEGSNTDAGNGEIPRAQGPVSSPQLVQTEGATHPDAITASATASAASEPQARTSSFLSVPSGTAVGAGNPASTGAVPNVSTAAVGNEVQNQHTNSGAGVVGDGVLGSSGGRGRDAIFGCNSSAGTVSPFGAFSARLGCINGSGLTANGNPSREEQVMAILRENGTTLESIQSQWSILNRPYAHDEEERLASRSHRLVTSNPSRATSTRNVEIPGPSSQAWSFGCSLPTASSRPPAISRLATPGPSSMPATHFSAIPGTSRGSPAAAVPGTSRGSPAAAVQIPGPSRPWAVAGSPMPGPSSMSAMGGLPLQGPLRDSPFTASQTPGPSRPWAFGGSQIPGPSSMSAIPGPSRGYPATPPDTPGSSQPRAFTGTTIRGQPNASLMYENPSVFQSLGDLRRNQQSAYPRRRVRDSRIVIPRTFHLTLYFLGDPEENKVPSPPRKHALRHNGRLGQTVAEIVVSDDPRDLREGVFAQFDYITGSKYREQRADQNFSLDLGVVAGSGYRDISWYTYEVTSREVRRLRITTLYVKPNIALYSLDAVADEDELRAYQSDNEVNINGCQTPRSRVGPSEAYDTGVRASLPLPTPHGSPQLHNNSIPAAPSTGGASRSAVARYASLESLVNSLSDTDVDIQPINVPQLTDNVYLLEYLPMFLMEINPEAPVQVNIDGSPTIDAGGPRRSFAWKLMMQIRNGCYRGVPIFDGEAGKGFISADKGLLYDNVPVMVAKFLVFSIMTLQKGMFGLHKKFVKAILCGWKPTADDFSVQDIPDNYAREIAGKVESVVRTGAVTWDEKDQSDVHDFLRNSEWGYRVNKDNASAALDFLKYKYIYDCRRGAIKQMHNYLKTTNVGQWLAIHEQDCLTVFPEEYPKEMTKEDFFNAIQGLEEEPEMEVYFREYVEEFMTAGRNLSELVEAITATPYLMGKKIDVIVDPEGNAFYASTCANQLRACKCSDQEEFNAYMNALLKEMKEGFHAI